MEQGIEKKLSSLSPQQREEFSRAVKTFIEDKDRCQFHGIKYSNVDREIEKIREIVFRENYGNITRSQ